MKISKQFADVMVQVHRDCFATAITELNLYISAEDSIDIEGMDLGSYNETANACTAVSKDNKVISTAPFNAAWDTRFDNTVLQSNATKLEFDSYKGRLKAIINQFISVEIMTKCLAIAVSSITLRLVARKVVKINNFQIDQAAKATILACTLNTRVSINGREKTMAQAIDDIDPVPVEIVSLTPEEDAEEERKAKEELDAFNAFLNAWSTKGPPPCGKDDGEKIAIATSVGMVGVLIMIIVLYLVSTYKKNLEKQ